MSDLIPDEERDVVAIAQDVLRGYGHDAIADALARRVSPVTREALEALFVAHDPDESHPDDQRRCICGETIGTSDGVVVTTDPYGHLIDCILSLLSVSPPAEVTDEMVEKAARVLLHDYQMQYDGGELSEFLDLARAALTAALGVLPAELAETERRKVLKPIEDFKRIPAETRAELIHMAEGRIKDVWADSPEGVDAATLASNVVAAQEFVWMQLAAGVDLRASQPVQVEVTDDMVERGLKVSREFPRKRGLDNAYNVMRAVLEAALGGGDHAE